MAVPKTLNLSIYEGDDFVLVVSIVDEAGAAVDITGFTYEAVVLDSAGAVSATATASVTNAAGGLVKVSLTDVQTDTLSGRLNWKLTQTDAGSLVRTLLRGYITIVADSAA